MFTKFRVHLAHQILLQHHLCPASSVTLIYTLGETFGSWMRIWKHQKYSGCLKGFTVSFSIRQLKSKIFKHILLFLTVHVLHVYVKEKLQVRSFFSLEKSRKWLSQAAFLWQDFQIKSSQVTLQVPTSWQMFIINIWRRRWMHFSLNTQLCTDTTRQHFRESHTNNVL